MFPILIELGPLKLYSYGLMMALGFVFAIHWASRRAPRYGLTAEFLSNIGVCTVVGGILGARAAHLAIEQSVADLFSFKFFEVWNGGMVFYGGLFLAVLACGVYAWKKKVNFFVLADVAAPALAFGQILGRLGCFLAGCCYGQQCDLPWAVRFTNIHSLAPKNILLHPTQLYEALGNLIVVCILLLVEKFYTKKFKGLIFVLYLSLYAVVRMIMEHYRGDTERGFVDFFGLFPNDWLSTSTFISALMILLAGVIAWKYRKEPSPFKA